MADMLRLQKMLGALLVACLIAFDTLAEAPPLIALPSFADFLTRHQGEIPKAGVKPLLTTARARHYRTVIASEAKKESNFADHYRLVIWGCGTDCRGFAIVDQLNGRVYLPSGINYVAGVMGNAEARVDFRTDSRLLILTGSLNDELEGKFFYEWTGRRLKLLHQAPVPKEDEAEPDVGSS